MTTEQLEMEKNEWAEWNGVAKVLMKAIRRVTQVRERTKDRRTLHDETILGYTADVNENII